MKHSLILLSFFLFQSAYAQNDWRIYNNEEDTTISSFDHQDASTISTYSEGNLLVISDPKIDSLILNFDNDPPVLKGYRVEIFFGKRKQAEQIKSGFLKRYSDWPIYIVWQQPNFKVQVGNFMTKLQAENTQQAIKSSYPNSYITITEIKQPEY